MIGSRIPSDKAGGGRDVARGDIKGEIDIAALRSVHDAPPDEYRAQAVLHSIVDGLEN
jgi:hypothetical protein